MDPGGGRRLEVVTIGPRSHRFRLGLVELFRSRDLVALFVHRDFVARYKQTVLGPLWYLLQPLITAIVFTVVFGNFAGIPTDGVPPFLFYMCGNVVWSYFAECLNKTHNTFTANAALFGKVYFPRLAVPVSSLISSLFNFAIQFSFFLLFLAYFFRGGAEVAVNSYALLLPLLVLTMAALGLGLGLIVSSATTRYRDLSHLVSFGVSLLMYATPVIYPLAQVPERYRWVILANPMTGVVECARHAFLGSGAVSLAMLVYSLASAGLVLVVGVAVFNRVETTFVDTV